MKKFLVFVLALVLAQPYIVFAAPLFGANADVDILYHCSGSCVDDTVDANDSNATSDVSWPSNGGETVYIGNTSSKFNKIVVDIQAPSGMAEFLGLTVQYYNGTDWASTSLTESLAGPNPFQNTGVQTISFTPPEDWAPAPPTEDPEGVSAYYIIIADGTQGAEVNQVSINTVSAAAATPEFSTIMYMATLGMGGIYLYWKTQKEQKLFA